jgi:purine nucleoside phosphorylase
MSTGLGEPSVDAAADAVRNRISGRTPRLALILGSGLGGIARHIEHRVEIPYAEIPGFPAPTVSGHAGCAIIGALDGVDVLAFAGRFHLYESH